MKLTTIIFTSFLILSCNQNTKNNNEMGIFDKLFGKKEPAKKELPKTYNQEIEKTSEMLDETIFWNIVDSSVKNTKNQDAQERFLVKEIEKLTPKQMIGFRLRTDKLLYDTYNSEMWCAGYIMNGGCSDDGFEYFRNWIISRGKDTYYKAKENPDSLISEFVEGEEYYDFESFWYVALTAFENKTEKELYDYISDDFKTNEGNYPNFEFTWKEEEPETMKAICPKLFEKLWN
ncbi:DUF4240 domain-containing protein [Tenacibaculum soleae]|uniref:DUF4240 domain-containing protein n=1 Tax=Tenacibaculum soleae TaxID=447689 RepID=UPI0026E372F0|nr:DUF4240 domain-containing protein [Tenacibaculum soleae]MDO6814060.1 DUF4240 domain-containing protein [Tenacibaculum soleae]